MAVPAIVKRKLSGSTDGQPIAVAATASAGTTIHTAYTTVTTLGHYDEVWLWAANVTTTNQVLVIEYGATGTANQIETQIPIDSGSILVLPGLLLQNTKIVRAFTTTANGVNVFGFVNRITE